MSARLELKIFLSSPGDVSDERGMARRVLDRLSQEYGLRDRVHLEEVSWDDPGAPVPFACASADCPGFRRPPE